MSLIAGRGCRWPPRRDSVSPCAPLSGGRDTHDGHENSPILVFFSNLLGSRSCFRSAGTPRRDELKNINRAWPDLHLPDGEGGTGSLARAPTHPASPLRLAE